jgi:hypothetical protein
MGDVGALLDPARRDAVLAELDRILESSAFRGSRRSQEFLRYVVTHALDGRPEYLKERAIGAEVFDRPADYDTGGDSIVRVKASEVRKRLAQYYVEAGAGPGVQIDLPAGSYAPEFRWVESAPAAPAVLRKQRWRRISLPASLLVLASATVVWWQLHPPPALDRFWAPVFRSPRPVLVCVAHPVVYRYSGPQIVRDPDHFVGVGDAFAMAHVSAFLARQAKPAYLRIGNDVSFADLRTSPVVLIGAFSNQWTMEITSNLRFVFDRSDGVIQVKDQMNPAQRWIYQVGDTPVDYGIVSRVFNSKTGDLVIAAAGLSHFGTQVAGEFLTNPVYLEQAVHGAPPDWPQRNMQLVLQADVIGKTPGPPKVVASWYW